MATSGELRAIIEELELVDIGDAANYLGEEATSDEEFLLSMEAVLAYTDTTEEPEMCDCYASQEQSS